MLYCDEFVCANPLGKKVKKCKTPLLCIRQLTKEKTFYVELN